MVEIERFACGRNLQTSFVIVDSKSIKNTDTAKEKGFDAGKKVSGYSGEKFASAVKKSDLHKFKVIPKRWIVERTFAWLEKNRQLWKNCERKLSTSRLFLHCSHLF